MSIATERRHSISGIENVGPAIKTSPGRFGSRLRVVGARAHPPSLERILPRHCSFVSQPRNHHRSRLGRYYLPRTSLRRRYRVDFRESRDSVEGDRDPRVSYFAASVSFFERRVIHFSRRRQDSRDGGEGDIILHAPGGATLSPPPRFPITMRRIFNVSPRLQWFPFFVGSHVALP